MWKLMLLFVWVARAKGECPDEDTSLAPLPTSREKNLPVCAFPYRDQPNCTCPSSMFECACQKIGRCGWILPGCIEWSKVVDGLRNCVDWSDELGDTCSNLRFQCDCFNTTCPGNEGCIRKSKQCDQTIDCRDGSDEVNCTCSEDEFECACHKAKNCEGFGKVCVSKDFQCDGYNSCGDWSDEENCTCYAYQFECACYKTKNCTKRLRGCIRTQQECNGIINCPDGSDEVNCTSCPEDRFECSCYKTKNCSSLMSGCIYKNSQCDGRNNCGDWSDEINCTCPTDKFECSCYKTKNCTSTWDGWISKYYQCDGKNHCGDWSDEVNCTCPANEFECACHKTKTCTSSNGCFSKSSQCDTFNDCGDWTDEMNCTCPAHKFECACVGLEQCIGKDLNCIDRSLLCDGKPDCIDGSDEKHYTCNCSGTYPRCPCIPNNTQCSPDGRCIPFSWINDSFVDCADETDEVCSVFEITCQFCRAIAVICPKYAKNLIHTTDSYACNNVVSKTCTIDDNNCGVDKVVCAKSSCKKSCEKLFFCESQQLIAREYFCDGKALYGCEDKSDEVQHGFGFKCSGSARKGVCVLPQANVYDSVAQCSDNSDICFRNGQFKCFQCLDRKLIVSSKQVCDGVVDCFDMSDECLCENQTLCHVIQGDCPQNQMHCKNNYTCVDLDEVLCNTSVQCVDQTNTKYCLTASASVQSECVADDNIFTQRYVGNESLCLAAMKWWFKGQEFGRSGAKQIYHLWCDGSIYDIMSVTGERWCPNRFQCFSKGKINIDKQRVCDGIIDCDDKSDELLTLCNKTRFYCRSKGKISINRKHICDGVIDCDDASDESMCRCENTRFYCTNQQPLSVELRLVQNGIHDCSDGSDECVNFAGNAFADVNEMIANPVYRGIFWVTGILALGGNIFVFVTTTRDLIKVNKDKNLFINTSIFILNLCVADLLMGIYLLAIITQATRFSGSYCLFDKKWRLSSLCKGLGALAIVSSEASAFTMTAMTTFRLISVFKPFLMRNVGVGKIVIAELSCWIFAFMVATVPLFNATSEYFITGVWFPNNFYATDFVPKEKMSLLAQRISASEPKSWYDVKRVIKNAFPRNSIKGEFGYYGETSVCLPRLFATTNEFSWEYSTFLITFNFLMFIYMVVAYFLIYKQSNRMKGSRSTDVSSKMQKRITRLILTDFCCWIPICMMGFLSVGGVKMPGDAYVLSASLLLPINSALNPLLYSKALGKQLSQIKEWVASKITSLRTSRGRPSHLNVRFNPRAEQEGGEVINIAT